jgi:hypothetical protein
MSWLARVPAGSAVRHESHRSRVPGLPRVRARRATALALSGEPDEAATVGLQAVQVAKETNSELGCPEVSGLRTRAALLPQETETRRGTRMGIPCTHRAGVTAKVTSKYSVICVNLAFGDASRPITLRNNCDPLGGAYACAT